VVGVSMRLWEGSEGAAQSGCCTLDDFLDARRVAELIGIPFYVMDFRDAFRRAVVDDFVSEYRRGRTPNPCARCNQFVKFAAFWDRARELGAELVATGHYARVRQGPDRAELWRGVEPEKDQSYFLFAVDAGVSQTNTVDRLTALRAAEYVDPKMLTELQEAFEFLTLLRLENQLQQAREGKPLNNYASPRKLTHLQKGLLREAFQTVARVQSLVDDRFRTAVWAQLGK